MSGVVVLLGSHNGSSFIDEQLASIHDQTIKSIDIVASDDGSTDDTLAILKSWQKKWTKGDFTLLAGPCRGFAENYRSLIIAQQGAHDYVAYADQDDIWDADKLERAIGWLEGQNEYPALYCGRTRNVNERGEFLRFSPLFSRPPQIQNALVQNIANGNTLVMNRKAMELVSMASKRVHFAYHDWWSYLVVLSCGGPVHYDSQAHVSYRQHGANAVGANDLWGRRWSRINDLFSGGLRQTNGIHLAGLVGLNTLLTGEARQAIDTLRVMRSQRMVDRLAGLFSFRIYHQTFLGNLGLLVAILFRKI